MTVTLLRGDAAHLPLPDRSVDLVVTSPPYFALRSYQDTQLCIRCIELIGKDWLNPGPVRLRNLREAWPDWDAHVAAEHRPGHYPGQIGSEGTPGEWLDALIGCVREWVRVLKPSGSIWVNLGDKYAAGHGGSSTEGGGVNLTVHRDRPAAEHWAGAESHPSASRAVVVPGTRPKSLLGLPWRFALRCIDELGLILRAELIWCLSGGARVYARTPTGDRPIMLRDLARAYRPENVQLWNGERWTQVLGWNRTPDDHGALELELRSGERIGCTPGHQWPTQRGLLRADQVRVGDSISIVRLPEPALMRTPEWLPNDDIGWLVGLYIAEGSRSEQTVQFAGHTKEIARHARLRRIAAALDGKCAVYQTGENTATCNLSGSVVLGTIDRYVSAGTAKTKRLRHAAWQRSDRFLAAVVDGYLSGDGHYDAKNDRWRLGFTQNDEWAADLRTLAARLGASLRLRRHDHQGFGRTFPGWRGEWRWTQSAHHNVKGNGEVVAIRRSRARDFYDIGVADEPHLFALASGVLSHNSKPNGLPESVSDRVRRSHETWLHFTVRPRYYAAIDTIRESYSPASLASYSRGGLAASVGDATHPSKANGQRQRIDGDEASWRGNPLGKLPGSVWSIASQPLTVPAVSPLDGRPLPDHFAAFPMEWPRRLILGWSPSGVCTVCGEGRRPVAAKTSAIAANGVTCLRCNKDHGRTRTGSEHMAAAVAERFVCSETLITGEVCACPTSTLPGLKLPPTRPSVILDPFGGTGTVALVADVLGRHGVSVDMSHDYCRLAAWRTTDPGERARAMQVDRPEPVPAGQLGLFEAVT